MTAFARAAVHMPNASLAWELKSVNGKGLDIRLRLPPGFDAHEAAIRSRMAKELSRGSIQAVLTVQRPAAPPQVRIDADLLRSLIATITAAVPAGAGLGLPTIDGLLAIRGVVDVVEAPEPAGQADLIVAAAFHLLDDVVSSLAAMRRHEGDALRRLLDAQVERIAALIDKAEHAPGRTLAAVRERLDRSVALLAEQVPPLDPQRLHQEAIILATRADVREELDRLRIHRETVKGLLEAGGPVGRRLDFLAQELAREANTLCSKSNDAALTAIGLDLRTQIEQFREQVQNLE